MGLDTEGVQPPSILMDEDRGYLERVEVKHLLYLQAIQERIMSLENSDCSMG